MIPPWNCRQIEPFSGTWRRLPPELRLAVAESASETMLPGTLCRWCLVDRSWYRIASAALYSCVILSPRDDDVDGAWRIQRFCETIVSNQSLAASVKALDFAVSREEAGIANQQQYLAILENCRHLIYLRNLQRPRIRDDTYLLAVPSGALCRLQWHDSDLRAFEELVESVYKPLHFRTNPDARGTIRTDVVRTDAQSCSRMLRDLRLIGRLPRVHDLPTGFFRNMVSKQLPQQKVMLAWCTKNYQNDRAGVDVALGTLKMIARILPRVELIELYVTDCDFFSGCPPTYSRASSTGLPCLYPKSMWDYAHEFVRAMAPLPFAVAIYHVLTPDLGYISDAPGINSESEYDVFRHDDSISSKPDFPYSKQDDMLEGRNSTGHGWQKPIVMLPHSAYFVDVKLEGGYHSLPFARWKPDKPAWDVLLNPPTHSPVSQNEAIDAQDKWDVDISLGSSDLPRPPRAAQIPRRGTLDWLRLVKRNLDFNMHDLIL